MFVRYPLVKVLAGALIASGLFAVGAAQAQQGAAICNQIRMELSGLQRLGDSGGGSAREANQLRAELARARNALRVNECDAQRGLFTFSSPPAVCAPLRAQAGQIEARLRQIDGADPNAPRRAQLLAALQRYNCMGEPQERGVIYARPQAPSLFEQLFGGRSTSAAIIDDRRDMPPLDPALEDELREKARLGGRTPVCVRSCDGFFFPVNFEGLTARDEHGAVCQALCPGAETEVLYMRLGADIETAATRDGRPYTSLPNAMRYRENRDPACFCRPPGFTVAHLAKDQVDIVEARKGDLVVTREQAEAMSRPKEVRGAPQPRNTRQTRNAPAPAPAEPVPVPESAIPTAGTASAGIGPRSGEQRVVNGAQGTVQEVVGADGVRRQVRVVAPAPNAPEPQPALRGAAQPSVQAPARAP
ncbi:MAG: DUF2865 domain-containing protein [Rhizobiales bacterium]|nr:DUF2865 domain-containing protein [Hyphomicrobiales bacterium]